MELTDLHVLYIPTFPAVMNTILGTIDDRHIASGATPIL
jgi:hypothetical protein